MAEWEVFLVISAIVSFGLLVGKPIISLTKEITQLNNSCKELAHDLKDLKKEFVESRTRIHDRIDEQKKIVEEHERRLHELDGEWSDVK